MTMNATDQRETSSLIASDKVEGINVYRSNGDNIGEIERVMNGNRSGKVAYAVMSFGGFMGFGEDYLPVSRSRLTYNESLGGYEVNIDEDELRDDPKYGGQHDWTWDDERINKMNT
jgi:PRC-barrel domain